MKSLIVGSILLVVSSVAFGQSSLFDYDSFRDNDFPSITTKEEEVISIARDAAYQSDGEMCALAITYGHPAIVDIHERSTWTIPTTMVASMLTQNAHGCVCIGEYSHTIVDQIPPSVRTRQNIRAMLFNVIANSALRHRPYQQWEEMRGIDPATQRFMVERIVNACAH